MLKDDLYYEASDMVLCDQLIVFLDTNCSWVFGFDGPRYSVILRQESSNT